MKILFCIRSYWYFKNVKPLLEETLARGADVTLLISSEPKKSAAQKDEAAAPEVERAIDELRLRFPRLEIWPTAERADLWTPVVNGIRRGIDLVHLYHPRFDDRPRTRKRAEDRALPQMTAIVRRARRRGTLNRLGALLRRADEALPCEARMVALLRDIAPDVLVITPLIDLGCNQNEIVRAAAAIGLPTIFMVHSWDNLSMKSPLRQWPTRMVVWNAVQQQEAVEFHAYPAERVSMVGAPHFDEWVGATPKRGRSAFLKDVGLDPDAPLIVYVGSTTFDFKKFKEQDFVRRWVGGLRTSNRPELRRANVLVRVHPQRAYLADQFAVPGDDRMVVWPSRTTAPIGADAKDDYLSSLYHADAVVGINTTAMIEAAFLGRPVLTILGTEFSESQIGTFHFAYLVNGGTGMVRTADGLEEHYEQLWRAVSGQEPFSASERAYAQMFTRAKGSDRSTHCTCDVMEDLVRQQMPAAPGVANVASPAALAGVAAGVLSLQALEVAGRVVRLALRIARRAYRTSLAVGRHFLLPRPIGPVSSQDVTVADRSDRLRRQL